MADVISGAEYVSIANNYGSLRERLDATTDYLYDAVYTIVLFNEFEPTLDLLQTFYDTYVLQTQILNNNTPYHAAIRALNNHVLLRAIDPSTDSGYTDINDWFDDQGVGKVLKPEWQTMCAELGFTIEDGFVL
jgi:hypothetical protein